MNQTKIKNRNLNSDNYCEQNVYIAPSNGYIAISLAIALIFNFLPLKENILIFRPDFLAITMVYWGINYPHKMRMSIAFCLGLLMDVGNMAILGQHALAYCIAIYLTLILGRRLRIFSLMQQAPQVGLILFIMQIAILLVSILSGAYLPGWLYFSATITSILVWMPISLLLSTPLKQKSDFNVL